MDAINLFFSINGRASRTDYWLVFFLVIAAWLVMAVAVWAAAIVGENFLLFFAFPCMIALAIATWWTNFAISVRRLHDLDKSAWWLVPYWLGPMLLNLMSIPTGGNVGFALWAISMLASLYVFIELGGFKGTPGPNRYGPARTQLVPALPATI